MTGAELLAELQSMPREYLNLEVLTEGCDCDGEVNEVRIEMTVGDAVKDDTSVIWLARTVKFQ